MRHRVASAILLLYPRRMREGHGAEIVALIDDLIAHDGRSHTRLFVRLAVDGLASRIASTAAVWTVVAALATTGVGALAISNLAAAEALHVPRTVHTVAPGRGAHQTPHRSHSSSRRSAHRCAGHPDRPRVTRSGGTSGDQRRVDTVRGRTRGKSTGRIRVLPCGPAPPGSSIKTVGTPAV